MVLISNLKSQISKNESESKIQDPIPMDQTSVRGYQYTGVLLYFDPLLRSAFYILHSKSRHQTLDTRHFPRRTV